MNFEPTVTKTIVSLAIISLAFFPTQSMFRFVPVEILGSPLHFVLRRFHL